MISARCAAHRAGGRTEAWPRAPSVVLPSVSDVAPAQVTGYVGADQLAAALTGCDLVIIPAGVPRKPGMTRDDLFAINAGIVKGLCEAIAQHAPKAIVNIISNPVNSTVPIAAEVFKKAGCFDAAKLFGVTTLDVVRANTFVSQARGGGVRRRSHTDHLISFFFFPSPFPPQAKNTELASTSVPVIGGHAGITILPLLSQAEPAVSFNPEELEKLTVRIQNAGTEVVEAKAGTGSATLSMAYAAARFAESCLRGLAGEPGVVECAYVASSVEPSLPYFSSKVLMGPKGAAEVYPVGQLTDYEKGWYAKLLPELKDSIEKGVAFANK